MGAYQVAKGIWKLGGKVLDPLGAVDLMTLPIKGLIDQHQVAQSNEYDDAGQERAADQAELSLRENDRIADVIPLMGTLKTGTELVQDVAAFGSKTFGEGHIKSTDELFDQRLAAERAAAATQIANAPQEWVDDQGQPVSYDPEADPYQPPCQTEVEEDYLQ